MPNIEMSEAAKAARRAYKREWYAKNKDKVAEYYREWCAKNKDKKREWRAKNKEKVNESQRRYWEKKALEKETAAKEQEAADA